MKLCIKLSQNTHIVLMAIFQVHLGWPVAPLISYRRTKFLDWMPFLVPTS